MDCVPVILNLDSIFTNMTVKHVSLRMHTLIDDCEQNAFYVPVTCMTTLAIDNQRDDDVDKDEVTVRANDNSNDRSRTYTTPMSMPEPMRCCCWQCHSMAKNKLVTIPCQC